MQQNFRLRHPTAHINSPQQSAAMLSLKMFFGHQATKALQPFHQRVLLLRLTSETPLSQQKRSTADTPQRLTSQLSQTLSRSLKRLMNILNSLSNLQIIMFIQESRSQRFQRRLSRLAKWLTTAPQPRQRLTQCMKPLLRHTMHLLNMLLQQAFKSDLSKPPALRRKILATSDTPATFSAQRQFSSRRHLSRHRQRYIRRFCGNRQMIMSALTSSVLLPAIRPRLNMPILPAPSSTSLTIHIQQPSPFRL